jgi:hypothetical protein
VTELMIKPESAFVLIRKWASAIDEAGKESEKQHTSQSEIFRQVRVAGKGQSGQKDAYL